MKYFLIEVGLPLGMCLLTQIPQVMTLHYEQFHWPVGLAGWPGDGREWPAGGGQSVRGGGTLPFSKLGLGLVVYCLAGLVYQFTSYWESVKDKTSLNETRIYIQITQLENLWKEWIINPTRLKQQIIFFHKNSLKLTELIKVWVC